MSSELFKLLGLSYVILKSILVSLFVKNVSGIADGSLKYLILVKYLVHGNLHGRYPVERIEYTEYVDAAPCSLLDELTDNIVRIVGVAYCVCTSEEHLQKYIRHLFPDHIKTLPRRLVKKSVGNVKCSSAPALK